jgi:hypothetical protein
MHESSEDGLLLETSSKESILLLDDPTMVSTTPQQQRYSPNTREPASTTSPTFREREALIVVGWRIIGYIPGIGGRSGFGFHHGAM